MASYDHLLPCPCITLSLVSADLRMHIPNTAALIIIDVQKGFDDHTYWGGARNNPDAEKRIAQLLQAWRLSNRPIFHIVHASVLPGSPLHPSNPGHEVKDEVKPLSSEPVIVKNVNSAFIGTDLEQRMRDAGIDTAVIVGLTTNHCVSTTTRMSGNFGFTTYLVSDATATFDRVGPTGKLHLAEDVHEINLSDLNREFCTVIETEDLLKIL